MDSPLGGLRYLHNVVSIFTLDFGPVKESFEYHFVGLHHCINKSTLFVVAKQPHSLRSLLHLTHIKEVTPRKA